MEFYIELVLALFLITSLIWFLIGNFILLYFVSFLILFFTLAIYIIALNVIKEILKVLLP